jgi:septum formation protein
LLTEAGYRFEVIAPADDEISHPWLTIRELTVWNAARKAARICQITPEAVVLAADTLVTIDGDVLGKPEDIDDAVRILGRLNGRAHEVWTAVTISQLSRRRTESFQEMSRVYFRALDDRAIRRYLAKIDPLDKAGAYAAQGHGRDIIERIDGSYSNVVGLPMEATMPVLREFGIEPAP